MCSVLRTIPIAQERVLVLAVIVVISGRLEEEGADKDDDVCAPHDSVRPRTDLTSPRTVSSRAKLLKGPVFASVKWEQGESLPHRVVGG